MPEATTSAVEMTCLQRMADLERLEGPWMELIVGGDPEGVAVILRLLLAHMASTSKRQIWPLRTPGHPTWRKRHPLGLVSVPYVGRFSFQPDRCRASN